MNENETRLKIQALVDGELTGREAEELRARLESDAGLRALHARLTAVRGLMAGAELPRTLPESGDFHWSQISPSATPIITCGTAARLVFRTRSTCWTSFTLT